MGRTSDTLSYDQLAAWASTIKHKTGKRLLGFPAGPQGLMHRFLEGFLYPSYTGGVVVPFRSEAAEAMWVQFADRYGRASIRTRQATISCNSRLLSGDVWIGFDHVARVLERAARKAGRISSSFRPLPGQRDGATCRCSPGSPC